MLFLMVVSMVGVVGCEKKADGGEKSGEEATAEQAQKEGEGEEAQDKAADEEGEAEEGEAAAADKEGEGEEAGGDAMTCKSVVTHAVTVLHDVQGDDAFLKKKDIPKLTEGCKAAGTLEKSTAAAECLVGIDSVDAMEKCEGANDVMKKWAENAPRTRSKVSFQTRKRPPGAMSGGLFLLLRRAAIARRSPATRARSPRRSRSFPLRSGSGRTG